MYTLANVGGKVLVEYFRGEDKKSPIVVLENGVVSKGFMITKGDIKGVVVAIGDGEIGWSLCNKKDVFNKDVAFDIALKRALVSKELSLKQRDKFYSKVPFTLNEMFLKMEERSEKYFNYDID